MTAQYGAPNNGPWTTDEVRLLQAHAQDGAEAIAAMLGRSVASVRHAAKARRISLRRKGERRGLILGQRGPWKEQAGADASRLSAIRVDVLRGQVDIAVLEGRILDELYGTPKPLCPACGQRHQERPTTGLCEVCHLRMLAQMHRDEVERREARRELWQERQRKHRRNKAQDAE